MMGRGEKAKRLANPVSKMAEALMADFPELPRPVHKAQLSMKKIISPEQNCRQNVIFFEESGLGQHYRVIHEKYATAEVVAKARTKTWEIYGRETLHFIFTISEWKSKVSI